MGAKIIHTLDRSLRDDPKSLHMHTLPFMSSPSLGQE
jgi:hypothetical protein